MKVCLTLRNLAIKVYIDSSPLPIWRRTRNIMVNHLKHARLFKPILLIGQAVMQKNANVAFLNILFVLFMSISISVVIEMLVIHVSKTKSRI